MGRWCLGISRGWGSIGGGEGKTMKKGCGFVGVGVTHARGGVDGGLGGCWACLYRPAQFRLHTYIHTHTHAHMQHRNVDVNVKRTMCCGVSGLHFTTRAFWNSGMAANRSAASAAPLKLGLSIVDWGLEIGNCRGGV
jgi:hypothetical protein